ncbi:hypothetical protein ACHAWO_013354 [Cyclotella atomus]|uniref:Uncharacterized protein n=1 Tax=Cyclotella atomus TaxID=382360 RepID=A0ABD3P696_9STRA
MQWHTSPVKRRLLGDNQSYAAAQPIWNTITTNNHVGAGDNTMITSNDTDVTDPTNFINMGT